MSSSYSNDVEKLEEYINTRNKKELKNLLNRITDYKSFFIEIRHQGSLRASKYGYDIQMLKKVYHYFKDNDLLCQNDRQYIESINNLWNIGCSIKKHLPSLNNSPKLKEFLAIVEFLFIQKNFIPFNQAEKITEYISTIIYQFLEQKRQEENHEIDFKYYSDYDEQYRLVEFISNYREAEVEIDSFNYHVERLHKIYTIKGDLEKYIRMGYILSDVARINYCGYALNYLKESNKQIETILEQCTTFFILKDSPQRLVVGFPKDRKIIKLFLKILRCKSFFPYETLELCESIKELNLNVNDVNLCLKSFGLSINDFIYLKRLFFIFSHSFMKKIKNLYGEEWYKKESSCNIVLQSIVFPFEKKDIIKILCMTFSKKKAQKLFDIFSSRSCIENQRKFDLQATPFVETPKYCYLLPNLILNSFLLRNTFSSLKIRFDSNDDVSPIEDKLEKICKEKNYFYKRNIKYKYNDSLCGDIDFFLSIGSKNFIFECKNSLPPENIFQLRTSYDYIKKANEQLKKIRRVLSNSAHATDLTQKLSSPLMLNNNNTITAIVMGNRIFTGYIIDNNIVCNIYEFERFLIDGTYTVANKITSMWREEKMSENDLEKYLSSESYIVKRIDNLTPFEERYFLDGKELVFSRFKLEMVDVI